MTTAFGATNSDVPVSTIGGRAPDWKSAALATLVEPIDIELTLTA